MHPGYPGACDWRVFESRDFHCKKAGNRAKWRGNLQEQVKEVAGEILELIFFEMFIEIVQFVQ